MSENVLDISSTLNKLLNIRGISEAELSRCVNIPRATINRLASGRTPDPRASTLQAISDYFNVSIDQLIGNKPLPTLTDTIPTISSARTIPVLNWQESAFWQDALLEKDQSNDTQWITTDYDKESNLFALKVPGESMSPEFQENTILLINPERQPKNKDFVIAHIKKNNETVFRRLILEGIYKILRANNPLFPPLYLEDEDKILGVVVQTRNSYG